MNSGIKNRLLEIPTVIGLKPTYLTESSEKWLVVVRKLKNIKQKEQSTPSSMKPYSTITKPRDLIDRIDTASNFLVNLCRYSPKIIHTFYNLIP